MKNDLEDNEYPVCPYCFEEHEDVYGIFDPFDDGLSVDILCSYCDNRFIVKEHITRTYTTRKLD